MKRIFAGIIILLPLIFEVANAQNQHREKILFDSDWKFTFGHPTDLSKDFNTGTSYFTYLAKAGYGDGASALDFDDRSWRNLDLPHDWVVEQPFDSLGSHSHGYKAVGRNFPDASVGWYRKSFSIDKADEGKQIFIDFDGVSRDAKVWVNGFYLGNEPSGYQSFSHNITELLNYGGENVIAVRADVTIEEGWYYEGGGIYRHVWLRKTNPLHIAKDGTFVRTEVADNKATIKVSTEVINQAKEAKTFTFKHKVVNANGEELAAIETQGGTLAPMLEGKYDAELSVSNPHLWSIEDPYLHKLITEVIVDGKVIDEYVTTFGIRTIHFDADKGFFLNGKHVKLKGTNNHQDHAGVGVAIPDELLVYRVKQLKAFGSNAYRSSHNPPTPSLLNICDSLGMVVIDENRLMGTNEHALTELERLIHRDRNHPSVIVWSIGNEEWMIEGNEKGAKIALAMQNYVKTLDTTRPVNAAISGGWGYGISTVIETMGFNYLPHGNTDEHHKKFPNQPGMGTEEGSTYATRGEYFTDDEKHYAAAYDKPPRENWYSIEGGWTYYDERDYLAGMFIWTGFDYRGEPTPYTWPSVTSYFGMMDLCGFPKDNVYYLKSWWQDEPVLHILPHWNWEGKEGQIIDVWVHSNCDEVELSLNGKKLGKKKMEKNGHLEWKVPYLKGTIKAVGYKNGKKVLTEVIKTTGTPEEIKLSANKLNLTKDKDVSVVTVQVLDKKGNAIPTADTEINFTIEGPGKIIGVGNGDPTSLEKETFIPDYKVIGLNPVEEHPLSKKVLDNLMPSISNEVLTKDTQGLKVYTSSFEVAEEVDAEASIKWFYQNIANSQAVYLNGKLIAEKVSDATNRSEIELTKANLEKGKNTFVVIGTPLKKKNEWDIPNKLPGSIQVYTPAKQWKRKLFNGLAQVIIQTKANENGIITLKATSPELESGELIIQVNSTK